MNTSVRITVVWNNFSPTLEWEAQGTWLVSMMQLLLCGFSPLQPMRTMNERLALELAKQLFKGKAWPLYRANHVLGD